MIPGQSVEELKTALVDKVDVVGTFFEVHWIVSRASISMTTTGIDVRSLIYEHG